MDTRRRVVFITPSLKTGGGNRVFIELANQLSEDSDTEISIIAPNNSSDKHTFHVSNKVLVCTIGYEAKSRLAKIINVIKTIRYLNKNCSNSILFSTDPLFSIFLFSVKCRRLYRFVQADDYKIFDDGAILGNGSLLYLYKRLCVWSYRFKKVEYIFNSRYIYEQYLQNSKLANVPYHLVHPAVDHSVFTPDQTKKCVKEKVTLCLVARKHPWKGIINFINVWREIESQYKDKVDKVILVSHDDLSCFDTSGITIIRPTSDADIAMAYCTSDIFISTSWWEGFGLPPLEAMACGSAVICSKSGGVNEYAKDGVNCLMFEPKNEYQLKEHLITLILNKNLRNKLRGEAILTAGSFTWENSKKQLMRILQDDYSIHSSL